MGFVHVIRDARDMIYRENRYFLGQHSWSYGSLETRRGVELSRQYLGDCYYLLHYDDPCQTRAETVMRLLEFLRAFKMDVGPLIEGIRDRGNIDRWRRAGATEVVELVRGVKADLQRFGYEL